MLEQQKKQNNVFQLLEISPITHYCVESIPFFFIVIESNKKKGGGGGDKQKT